MRPLWRKDVQIVVACLNLPAAIQGGDACALGQIDSHAKALQGPPSARMFDLGGLPCHARRTSGPTAIPPSSRRLYPYSTAEYREPTSGG
jgi:hypothetical protein